MEGLGAASAVIAVVSLAGQVVQGCSYLREVFENATTAPREIRLLAIELSIIEGLVRATPDVEQHKEELDFCQERVLKLRKVVEEYGELDGVAPQKKWGKRLAMAMNAKKIDKHLASLREAKRISATYTECVSAQYSRLYLFLTDTYGVGRSAHSWTLIKSDKILENIQQLSTSYSEASRIVSRTEGRIEDIARITEQIQLALPELASRFMLRENSAMIRDENVFQRLTESLSSVLRDQLSEHMSQLTLASRETHHSRPGIHIIATGHEQICSSTAQGVAMSPLTIGKRKCRTQSPIDQRIFELSGSSPRDPGDESTVDNRPRAESTSNYNTQLGEVIMRTISAVYFSLEEISAVDFPSVFQAALMQQAHFPVTITTTEILLLPRSWAQARGATLRCEQLSGPIFRLDDMCLEIKNFKRRRTSSKPLVRPPKPQVGTATSELTHIRGALGHQRPTSSSLLLYTAFKTAFLATQLRSKDRRRPQQLHMISHDPISRNSFDDDINDALELVHLWIESELDAEFCRTAFPQDGAATEEQWEVAMQAGSPRVGVFQRLRMEYISKLVMELVFRSDRANSAENPKLDMIHQSYWERVERMAKTSSIAFELTPHTLNFDVAYVLSLLGYDPEWTTVQVLSWLLDRVEPLSVFMTSDDFKVFAVNMLKSLYRIQRLIEFILKVLRPLVGFLMLGQTKMFKNYWTQLKPPHMSYKTLVLSLKIRLTLMMSRIYWLSPFSIKSIALYSYRLCQTCREIYSKAFEKFVL